jgi:endoglucanase
MNAQHLALLEEVLRIPTAPYNEGRVIAYLEKFAAKHALELKRDDCNNLIMRLNKGGAPFGITAHMDHPGFEALEVEGSRVLARFHGGVPPALFVGARVLFYHGEAVYPGAIRFIETRIRAPKEPPRVYRVTVELEQSSSNLVCGDLGVWDLSPFAREGKLIKARGHDDPAGVGVVLSVFEECINRNLQVDLHGVFTCAEEAGFVGCNGLIESGLLPRDLPLVIIECSLFKPNGELGKGPVIRVGDRRAPLDPVITWYLEKTAERIAEKESDFKFQRALMDGGTCEATLLNLHGYRAGGISLPLLNYHNVNRERICLEEEGIHEDDFLCAVSLLSEAAVSASSFDAIRAEGCKAFTNMAARGMHRLRNGRWEDAAVEPFK